MKRLICILASAALLGACEQKTEVVAPAAPADKKTDTNGTPASQERKREKTTMTTTDTVTNAPPADGSVVEKKTESTTTTSASPNP